MDVENFSCIDSVAKLWKYSVRKGKVILGGGGGEENIQANFLLMCGFKTSIKLCNTERKICYNVG